MFETLPLWAKQTIVITGMLFFGTCTVVIQKVIFNMKAVGRDGDEHEFEKPWFQTEVMFVGMFGCLAVYEILHLIQFLQARNAPSEQRSLMSDAPSVQQTDTSPPMPKWKQYCVCVVPAIFDLTATAAMNIGLVWISASVWQMLRGSMVIFSALFSRFCLRKTLYLYHWIAVGVVVFALCVVAFSSLMTPCDDKKTTLGSILYARYTATPTFATATSASSSSLSSQSLSQSQSVSQSQSQSLSPSLSSSLSSSSSSSSSDEVTTTEEVIGIILVVVAQVIQASQIVIEQYLLEKVDINPVLIVGLEGLWGGIVCSLVLFIVYWIPAPVGEDTIDSFIMIGNSGALAGTIVAYATAILCYNMFGMLVTKVTNAVVRTILEGMRTLCIWMVDLFIYYVIKPDDPDFGEKWTEWSYLQLCGFGFLLLGMLLYNGIIRIEGLYYPPPAPPKDIAPSDDA